MKSRPWGRKSEPAFTLPPSAFTLLPHRLPRPPQSNRHPAAAVIHNGLSTEKLSTSLPAGLCKTFSPSRLRTRIYKYRSPVGCSRGVYASLWKRVHAVVAPCPAPPCAGWGRAKAKADAPSRSAEPCRLCAESLCAKAECTRPTPLLPVRSPRGYLSTAEPRPLMGELPCAKAECTRQTPPLPVRSPRGNLSTAEPLPACVPNHCVQRRKCTRPTPPLPVRSPRDSLSTAAPLPVDGRSAERKGGSAQGQPRPCPCTLPAATCLRPCPRPLMGVAPCVLPAVACLRPRPRRLNGHPASAGGRENDRMAHRRTTTPTHRTQRGNDTCTIRVPRRKGAQSVVHNLYFSSSRPASFCTTFPQSCTDRPVKCRKEHKSLLEGLIFRVLPPAFPTYPPKAIVQNTPAPPPFSPRKTPRFAPTRNRARTLASAERDNTPRPAHSSRFQRDTNESVARRKLIFAPPKAENGGVCGLKC